MSLGMVGYGVQNLLSRAFYAGQDGKTPMISGIVSILVNLALCWGLSSRLDVAGLSFATAVSSTVAAVILLVPTVRRYRAHWDRTLFLGLLKMLAATGVMSLAVLGSYRALSAVLQTAFWVGCCCWGFLRFAGCWSISWRRCC